VSNPYTRAERYRHVAIERLEGWIHSWWVCAHERRLCGVGDLRIAASAALRLRHGARVACKRLREERDNIAAVSGARASAMRLIMAERDAARLELRALEWLHEQYDEDYPHDWFYRGSVVWTMSADGEETEHATYASAALALGWEGRGDG
jgi:hypothetical protein